jgi:hypothetical protein
MEGGSIRMGSGPVVALPNCRSGKGWLKVTSTATLNRQCAVLVAILTGAGSI